MPADAKIGLIASRSRGRRIAFLAGALLAGALLLGWLESGKSVVIYNDTPEPVAGVTIRVASIVWNIDTLAPGESRRWHPPAGAAGDLFVTAANWGEGRPVVVSFEPQKSGNLIVHLGALGTITSSTESTWWRKLQEW